MVRPHFFVRVFAFIVFAVFVLSTTNLAAQSAIPFVNQPLVPSSIAPGSGELALTVNGTGFGSTSVVKWNGTPVGTAFVSTHQLVADVPSSALAAAGTASITVFSPTPGGGTSNVALFTITNPTKAIAFSTSMIATGLTPGGVVVADFNGDGKPDLAFVNVNQPDSNCYSYGGLGTISILLGNGDGSFTNTSTLCFPNEMGNLAVPQLMVGDFNGDGKADLVGLYRILDSAEEMSVAVFYGNGDGTFNCCSGPGGFYDGIGKMIGADFNGDGYLDLAFSAVDDLSGEGLSYLFFGPSFTLGGGCCFGQIFSSVATGDFNNDGILDWALVGESGVVILLGNGDGSFTPAASQPSVTLADAASVISADFDGDGILDLAIADAGSTAMTILKGNGDGTFTQVSGEPPLSHFANSVAAYDFNGDGKLDLVFSSAPNTISIYLGNGDGTFQAGLIQSMDYAPYGVAVGDFNGDGRLDLAVANADNNTVSILLQTATPPGRAIVALATSQAPAYVGQSVSYTAVVSSNRTAPTGSVVFKQGATILGTVPLQYGQASFTTTFANAGTFPMVARYSGDQNYRPRNSNLVKQVVNKYATGVLLYSNDETSPHGQPVTFTAMLSSMGPMPTGKVMFKNGNTSIGIGELVDGVATLTRSNLPRGTFSITAIYQGDNASEPSTSPVWTQVID